MLENMASFFEARIADYDEHMLHNITGAREFYPACAACLPMDGEAALLDLGCGTGLELQWYFRLNPTANVTGIDLSPVMLEKLAEKFPDKRLTLLCGSYFDLPFGVERFDAAVSVESLHHFTQEEKIPLYRKLCHALKQGGYFILTDYFAENDMEERCFRMELDRIKRESNLDENGMYHFDTPLTAEHETQALLEAGFTKIEILKNWGATYLIRASK